MKEKKSNKKASSNRDEQSSIRTHCVIRERKSEKSCLGKEEILSRISEYIGFCFVFIWALGSRMYLDQF